MKKGASLGLAALLALAGSSAYPLDWSLPVTTLRLETATGSEEDPDDETIEPSSVRATASLRVREEADPAVLGLTVRASGKDYYLQAGDYGYVEVEQDGSMRFAEAVKLGYTLLAKDLVFAQPDASGLSKDSLAFKAGLNAAVAVVKGTTLEGALSGRWQLAVNDAQSLQGYTISIALSSRIGEWVFGARYRGEFRLPLGSASGVTSTLYHTGALSLEWDPNR